MKCEECGLPAFCRCVYSTPHEAGAKELCEKCGLRLHQEMLAYILTETGTIQSFPLEDDSDGKGEV